MRVKTARTDKYILLDDEDAGILTKVNRSYSVSSHGYAVVVDFLGFIDGKYAYKKHYLHRLIMKAPKHLQVDHINGDRLDNRKENLRLCTNKSNNRNKPPIKGKYKGIFYDKKRSKWCSQITKNRKVYTVGSNFTSPEEAALAYNKFARRLHGKYAYQNIVE